MNRRSISLALFALFSILVLSGSFGVVLAGADGMSAKKDGMMKEEEMMDEKPMMAESDSMMAITPEMMDEKPMMEESDGMMADTGKMMDDSSEKMMK